jgi:hypothetical protein
MKNKNPASNTKSKYTKYIFTAIIGLCVFFYKQLMVLAFIVGGWFVAPEASSILYHYCFGNGETLTLDSTYLKRSYIINKVGKKLRNGQTIRNYGFKQKYDWRLSYALNPFTMSKQNNQYHIEQWIEFDKSGKVHTVINLGLFQVRIEDAIAHAFNCTPFLVVCDFNQLTKMKNRNLTKFKNAPL